MKKTLIIIFILIFHYSFSQDFSKIKFKRYYSNSPLISHNISRYNYLKRNKGNNKIEIKIDTIEPRKIIDSLKIIDREKFIKKAIGKWKYANFSCGGCSYTINGETATKEEINKRKPKKYLEIFDDMIHFLNENEDKTKTEKIKFTEHFYWASNLTDLVFSDKSIWEITIDESGNYLKIYKSGEETERGRTPPLSCGNNVEYYIKEK